MHLEQILSGLGTEEDFTKYAKGKPHAAFIRHLVGLDNKTIDKSGLNHYRVHDRPIGFKAAKRLPGRIISGFLNHPGKPEFAALFCG